MPDVLGNVKGGRRLISFCTSCILDMLNHLYFSSPPQQTLQAMRPLAFSAFRGMNYDAMLCANIHGDSQSERAHSLSLLLMPGWNVISVQC